MRAKLMQWLNFPCIFQNFLCIHEKCWPHHKMARNVTKFFLVTPEVCTQPWANEQHHSWNVRKWTVLRAFWHLIANLGLTQKPRLLGCLYIATHTWAYYNKRLLVLSNYAFPAGLRIRGERIWALKKSGSWSGRQERFRIRPQKKNPHPI